MRHGHKSAQNNGSVNLNDLISYNAQQRVGMILPNSGRRGPDSPTLARHPGLASTARTAVLSASLLFCVTGPLRGDNAQTPGFPLRNHSPFTAIVGVPGRWPNGAQDGSELAWNMASHSERESLENESLFLDGETHVLTARVQRQLGERLQLGLEIPWVSHSGGFLDDAIDTWHDLTGLTEGIRPEVPSNEVSYVYGRGEDELFRLDDSASGIGQYGSGGRTAGDVPGVDRRRAELGTGPGRRLARRRRHRRSRPVRPDLLLRCRAGVASLATG
jgi:hypothetical protein